MDTLLPLRRTGAQAAASVKVLMCHDRSVWPFRGPSMGNHGCVEKRGDGSLAGGAAHDMIEFRDLREDPSIDVYLFLCIRMTGSLYHLFLLDSGGARSNW